MHIVFWKLGFGGVGFNNDSRVWPKMAAAVNVLSRLPFTHYNAYVSTFCNCGTKLNYCRLPLYHSATYFLFHHIFHTTLNITYICIITITESFQQYAADLPVFGWLHHELLLKFHSLLLASSCGTDQVNKNSLEACPNITWPAGILQKSPNTWPQ